MANQHSGVDVKRAVSGVGQVRVRRAVDSSMAGESCMC